MAKHFDYFREPADHYLQHVQRDAGQRAAMMLADATSPFDPLAPDRDPAPDTGTSPALLSRLERLTEALGGELVTLLRSIHDHPETAFQEHHAIAGIAALLSAHGFEPEIGVHGLDTALRAEFSTPGFDPERDRSIAILAEYDALVGLGHGCGHNVIAAAGIGAAIALRDLLTAQATTDRPETGRPGAVQGRIVVLGTPAEEGRTGKEYMARHGAFEGLDAAIMVHPFGHDISSQVWLGRRVLTAAYSGRSAHASAQPFQGRNALDAASLAYQGIGLLRQQMLPVDRIHAVIVEGGRRASIIPDRARLDLYVRSEYPDTLLDLSRRVENVLRGAALMTETDLTLEWDEDPPSLPVRTNAALTRRWVAAQRRRGRNPLPPGVVPETQAASTDFGNVSYLVPGIHPLLKIAPADVALHTEAFKDAARSPAAEAAAVDGAYGLAATALDFLCDAGLARSVAEEFEAAGGPLDAAGFFAE